MLQHGPAPAPYSACGSPIQSPLAHHIRPRNNIHTWPMENADSTHERRAPFGNSISPTGEWTCRKMAPSKLPSAHCTTSSQILQLLWVLLGLYTTLKEDLDHSVAEMEYGQPLVVTGEFFSRDSPDNVPLEELRQVVRHFTPCSPHPPVLPSDVPSSRLGYS